MQEWLENFRVYAQDHALGIVVALGVLMVGWVVLRLVTHWFKVHVLRFFRLNELFEHIIFKFDLERLIARVFFFVMLIVLFKIASQFAKLTEVDNFLDSVLTLIGNLGLIALKALIPLFAAVLCAWITKRGILFFGHKVGLDSRIGSRLDAGEALSFSFTKSLAEMGYGVVFLLFLPAILAGLGLRDLSDPMQKMVENTLAFLPQLFAAVVILAVGWFIAKIIRDVITGLLVSLGVDSVIQKMSVDQATGGVQFSRLGGTLAYGLILILVFIQALKKLSLDALTDPMVKILDTFFQAVPNILFALGLVLVTYFIAKMVAQLVAQVLEGMGFNNILEKLGLTHRQFGTQAGGVISPSQIVGHIAFYALMFFATIEALDKVGLVFVAEIVKEVTVFAGRVLLGLVVFGLGLFVANIVTKTIRNSNVTNAHILAHLARVGILILVGAMALTRMGLADEIVNIAFGLILGALALGTGLAFGLGGREHASEVIKEIRSKFK
ncbi:MAG: mechanosensitive ion channel [Bdellovibrionaceae bacterium]|nr:mechanosensitive ion channel [Pseudobdellovibrionaceae bacterium]